MQELIDLYNKERRRTGKIIPRGAMIPKGSYRLVVHAAIFNSKGEMLIQKRSASKRLWSDKWDISVGGAVSAHEKSNQAMQREIKEELGVDIDLTKDRPIFTFNFFDGFDDIYLIEKNLNLNELVLQASEVSEVKYATYEEIVEMMQQEKFIIYYDSFIKLLFDTYSKKNIYIE